MKDQALAPHLETVMPPSTDDFEVIRILYSVS